MVQERQQVKEQQSCISVFIAYPNSVQFRISGQRSKSSKKGTFTNFSQKCLAITQTRFKITLILAKKGRFLSNVTNGSVRLPDADFFWIIHFQKFQVATRITSPDVTTAFYTGPYARFIEILRKPLEKETS